jgi:hypothetical protein
LLLCKHHVQPTKIKVLQPQNPIGRRRLRTIPSWSLARFLDAPPNQPRIRQAHKARQLLRHPDQINILNPLNPFLQRARDPSDARPVGVLLGQALLQSRDVCGGDGGEEGARKVDLLGLFGAFIAIRGVIFF